VFVGQAGVRSEKQAGQSSTGPPLPDYNENRLYLCLYSALFTKLRNGIFDLIHELAATALADFLDALPGILPEVNDDRFQRIALRLAHEDGLGFHKCIDCLIANLPASLNRSAGADLEEQASQAQALHGLSTRFKHVEWKVPCPSIATFAAGALVPFEILGRPPPACTGATAHHLLDEA
jgi:hypothetical protein